MGYKEVVHKEFEVEYYRDTEKVGFVQDAEKMKKLELGKTYTVYKMLITDSYCHYWLKEVPNEAFNSIHFRSLHGLNHWGETKEEEEERVRLYVD